MSPIQPYMVQARLRMSPIRRSAFPSLAFDQHQAVAVSLQAPKPARNKLATKTGERANQRRIATFRPLVTVFKFMADEATGWLALP